ncbi:MAG: hypothetical protein OXG72_18235 [Acidobacteria bacterium]|nr:hypothetical protein [Acidobacteriota bacterium]
MFSRTWLAVLAGSVVLWGMGQLGGGLFPDSSAGGLAVPAPVSPADAAAAPRGLAACLEEVVSPDAAASSRAAPDVAFVERRYRERCRPLLRGEVFDAFAVLYGERARAAVAAILDREARLAAELAAGPQAAALDADLVWAAALGRAASDVRAFDVALDAWFDAWERPRSGGAVVSPDGAAGR